MYTVMVSSECAPVAKVGGLADVVAGLSREIQNRDHVVEIILPKYSCMRYEKIAGFNVSYHHLMVPWYNTGIPCTVWFGFVDGLRCYFIEPHSGDNFFNRPHHYGFPDEVMRWAFFSKAALEFMLKTGKRPNIIHCHDWQTALLPVLLFEMYQHHGMHQQRVCYTIHNFKHQGISGPRPLWATGLLRDRHFFDYHRLRDNFNHYALNFMKGGVVYANFTTTVSPNHANEARFSDQGYGLGHTLHVHQNKFGGVLNGIDYHTWNPETDAHIPHHFNRENVQPKYGNKGALRHRLLLRDSYKPIIAYVGRLDGQKGVHLIRHALFYSLWNGAQFVLLGSSTQRDINAYFHHLKGYLNNNEDCHLELRFDEDLAHLIYAGADIMVVPSLFEPCGLTQMIAMRYGTVPIVRDVGGLHDTVLDHNYAHAPLHERNGYVFKHPDYHGLESAMKRAIGLWYHFPELFRRLMLNGMARDFSWRRPAEHYLNIYEYIRHR